MKIFTHNDEICTFDEVDHLYTLSDGIQLESVTTYAKKYFNTFDAEKIATAYALKNNLDKDDVIKMWKEKGNKASAFGTACHKYAENQFNAIKQSSKRLQPSNLFEKAIYDKITDLSGSYDVVDQEFIIFSRQLGIAGTVDLLLGVDDTLYICDWKTNEEIKIKNPYQSCKKFLFNYPDCDKTKYSVQLNLYLKIILTENYFPQYTKYAMVLYHVQSKNVVEIFISKFPRFIFDNL